jgi:hypothetical protein
MTTVGEVGAVGYTTSRRARASSSGAEGFTRPIQRCVVPVRRATSRARLFRPLAVALPLVLALALPLAAQDTTRRAPPDSLEERLRRAEESIELLRRQMAAQAAAGVQTRSRVQMEISGRVLLNGFTNSGRVNVVDVPQFVLPNQSENRELLYSRGSVGMAIRQSSLGLAVTVGDVLGGTLAGDVDLDFFGSPTSNASRAFPLPRLRTARAFLRWPRVEVMAGAETPLIADQDPVSLSSVGTPLFALAGNLWFWLPQLRVTAEMPAGPVRLALQGAVLSPGSGESPPDVNPADFAERTRSPFVEGRLRLRWGGEDEMGELGLGVHTGRLGVSYQLGPQSSVRTFSAESRAVAVDLRAPLAPFLPWLEVRGEAYRGRGLRGLGGGGIGQTFAASQSNTGEPSLVEDTGWWLQLNARPGSVLELGAGCGVDDPKDDPRPISGRLRNSQCEGHVIARPGGGVFVGLAYRKMETRYLVGDRASSHLNLATGFEF